MAIKYSKILKVDHLALLQEGVFDAFINIDTPLYVDPFLLKTTKIPEFVQSYPKMMAHFATIIQCLEKKDLDGAAQKLLFKEMPYVSLGYSAASKSGSGIGIQLATQVATTVQEVLRKGVKDPQIFEVMGLFEDKIGPDRISDMTVSLIYEDLLAYTARVAKNLELTTKILIYNKKKFLLPYDGPKTRNDNFLVFVPSSLLRDLPASLDWQESESINPNRSSVLGGSWKEASKNKELFKKFLLEDPRWIQKLLLSYNKKKLTAYDFKEDPKQFFQWEDKAKTVVQKSPIKFPAVTLIKDQQKLFDLAAVICIQIEKMIKNNGLNLFLRHSKLRERTAQLFFYEIFEHYCESNNLPVSVQYENKESLIRLHAQDENKRPINVLIGVKFSAARNVKTFRTDLAKRKASICLEIEQRFRSKNAPRPPAVNFPADTLHLYKEFLVNQGF